MKDYNLMSLVEIAVDIQSQPNTDKTTFLDLYNKVCEIKGFDEEEKRAHIAQFYTDITASGDFVYCGEDLWDLKRNQKLEALESEFYNEHIAEESDEEEEEKPKPKKPRSKAKKDALELEEEENVEEQDSEDESYESNATYDDDYDSNDEEYDGYEKDFDYDPDDDSSSDDDDDSDEEKYNAIMDDYENLYDD